MGNKNLVIGTLIVLVSFVTIALFVQAYLTIPAVNPIATLAAITVAIVGIAWLKKTTRH